MDCGVLMVIGMLSVCKLLKVDCESVDEVGNVAELDGGVALAIVFIDTGM